MTQCKPRLILAITFLWLLVTNTAQAQSAPNARLIFSAFKNGQWDLFSVSAQGDDLRQITNDQYEDSDPAYSPDGRTIAYASRRLNNWDIYLLDLTTLTETQLTHHPHYDGAPAWHPTGHQLAFESYRSGDLEVWSIDLADDKKLVNLTTTAAVADFDPAWDSSGTYLYFTSQRDGNNDIWSLEAETRQVSRVTVTTASESEPFWDASTGKIGFTRNDLGDKDLYLVEPTGGSGQQISWLSSLTDPIMAEADQTVFGIFRLDNAAQLIRLDAGQPMPKPLTARTHLTTGLGWHRDPIQAGIPVDSLAISDVSRLYTETMSPSASVHGEPYDLVRLNDLTVASPWLADTVDESYQALRFRVRDELGYDFLGEMSETWRPINFFSDVSQYSSWHKSGRAFDTRFDLPGGRMQLVRENVGGETYWRIMLWCQDQSGRCGRPITARPWNYSANARVVLGEGQGGVEAPPLSGYYLDFTTLAQIYGWERIASFDDEEFSWTWHFKAFEYWHFQKILEGSDGARNWYQAMLQVYPRYQVESFFTWSQMRNADEDAYLIAIKGVPLPPDAERWWQALVP